MKSQNVFSNCDTNFGTRQLESDPETSQELLSVLRKETKFQKTPRLLLTTGYGVLQKEPKNTKLKSPLPSVCFFFRSFSTLFATIMRDKDHVSYQSDWHARLLLYVVFSFGDQITGFSRVPNLVYSSGMLVPVEVAHIKVLSLTFASSLRSSSSTL